MSFSRRRQKSAAAPSMEDWNDDAFREYLFRQAVFFTERRHETHDRLAHWHEVVSSAPPSFVEEKLMSWRFVKKLLAEAVDGGGEGGGEGGTDEALMFEICKLLLYADRTGNGNKTRVVSAAKNALEEYVPFCVHSLVSPRSSSSKSSAPAPEEDDAAAAAARRPGGRRRESAAAGLVTDLVCFAVSRLGDAGRGCLETSFVDSTSSPSCCSPSSTVSASYTVVSSGRRPRRGGGGSSGGRKNGSSSSSSPPSQEAAVVDNLVTLLRKCWSVTAITRTTSADASRILSAVKEAMEGWRVTDTRRLLRHPRLPQNFVSAARTVH